MRYTYFQSPADINNNLLVMHPIQNQTLLDAMYFDPWYGLNNPENYYRWNAFQNHNTNTTANYKRLAWVAELRSYWNLTAAQLQEMQYNWNYFVIVQEINATSIEVIPSPEKYQNTFGIAYWQWCSGLVTENIANVDSVAKLGTNAFAGYYEISYFKTNFFNY